MRTLGNILWHFPFFGFLLAALTYLAGGILTATVVAAPIGLGLMEYGKFLFAPFTRSMIRASDLEAKPNNAWKTYSTVITVLYFPFGLILGGILVIQIALLFFTIVGIPVAIVLAKSLGTYVNPVNKKCVSQAVADELARRDAQSQISKHVGA